MRNDSAGQTEIATTGINYSTSISILHSPIYLSEVQLTGEWLPGHHKTLVTPEIFAAAHRGKVRDRHKGKEASSDSLTTGSQCGCVHLVTDWLRLRSWIPAAAGAKGFYAGKHRQVRLLTRFQTFRSILSVRSLAMSQSVHLGVAD
jgi:hypothetical protein